VIEPDKDASTADLVREALDEARELMKLEVALAKNDVRSDLARARWAAIAILTGAFALNVACAMALFALAAASHAEVMVAAGAAVVLLALAGGAGFVAYRAMPTRFLGHTRERLGEDIRALGERAHGA
jgi:uncharacterized membrane protein YqjE